MRTTTYMDIELTKKERRQLLEAYIPRNFSHYFDSDADLNEVFQAYINFADDKLADEYMNYVVACAQGCNEYTDAVNVLTAKNWLEAKATKMKKIISEWKTQTVEDIDFGSVEVE